MRLLILGSGAREHALAHRLAGEPPVSHITCAPGNAGMAAAGSLAAVSLSDPAAMLDLAAREQAALTIVGPELPLSVGVVDRFLGAGRPILGPTRAAARLETSKVWAKQFMARHGVPTAEFQICDSEADADAVIASGRLGWPLVLKADGLAAGKGVVLAGDAAEARAVARTMLSGEAFGEAGRRIVLERCLRGQELSYFVLSDGHRAMPLGSAQDHKRAFDDDQGPNTGGMGAFAPSPLCDAALEARILEAIVHPTLAGLRAEGTPYRGFLYCGLMLTDEGPYVIEFNARLGDPEAQVVLPLVDEPLLPLLDAAAAGSLPDRPIRIASECQVGVVVASKGYPGTYETGKVIEGLDRASALEGVTVYHAGTALRDGAVVTAGGRVLTVVGQGRDFRTAIDRAYAGVAAIQFEGKFFRTDIGRKAIR
ncbi:MAG TPA: phosphoribosylamine--glycine ligase [Vicinamibacterales bacterium]